MHGLCLLFWQIPFLLLERFDMAAPSERWHPLTDADAKKPDKNSGLVSFLLQHSEMVLLKFCYWLSPDKKQTPDWTFFPQPSPSVLTDAWHSDTM